MGNFKLEGNNIFQSYCTLRSAIEYPNILYMQKIYLFLFPNAEPRLIFKISKSTSFRIPILRETGHAEEYIEVNPCFFMIFDNFTAVFNHVLVTTSEHKVDMYRSKKKLLEDQKKLLETDSV